MRCCIYSPVLLIITHFHTTLYAPTGIQFIIVIIIIILIISYYNSPIGLIIRLPVATWTSNEWIVGCFFCYQLFLFCCVCRHEATIYHE